MSKYILAVVVLALGICWIWVVSVQSHNYHPRTTEEVESLCRDMFRPGDRVNGMPDSCYDDFRKNGLLTEDGLHVKEQS